MLTDIIRSIRDGYKRPRGWPRTRWCDTLIRYVGPTWSHVAKDKKLWKACREGFLLWERERDSLTDDDGDEYKMIYKFKYISEHGGLVIYLRDKLDFKILDSCILLYHNVLVSPAALCCPMSREYFNGKKKGSDVYCKWRAVLSEVNSHNIFHLSRHIYFTGYV